MKFLVLGCNGMAGHLISLYLKEKRHEVIGFAFNKSEYIDTVVGDAKDTSKLEKLINNEKFDTIINCIGILNESAERNKADAVFLNSYLPHFLSKITENTNTQVIHMSTDCVFSGEKGEYTEKEFKDGKSFYDRTKALGEIEDEKNLTLRQSIIGPDINENGIGLFNWFMKQNNEINGYSKVIWTGVTTLELAKVMELAAEKRIHGLINMVPKKSISKYDLLSLFNKYMRNNEIIINKQDKPVINKSLVRTNYEFDYSVPDYEEMIAELSNWINNHKYLYKHYFK